MQALVRRGLLQWHRHPASTDGPASLVHLTEAGRVVLAQVEGLQIRALAALVEQLGEAEADRLRSAVAALGTTLEVDRPTPATGAGPAGRRLALPARLQPGLDQARRGGHHQRDQDEGEGGGDADLRQVHRAERSTWEPCSASMTSLTPMKPRISARPLFR